ncbi:unnamed protein product [Effrenium voratum]|nr:unnamed protein product [Effrenium voratum]
MALQSAGGASLPFWGGSYSPLRSATLAVEERDETSPRSSPRARPESAASLPSAGGAAAASFWATETPQEENLAHLEGVGWWQMPLCYFFALLLWAMLFLAPRQRE